MYEHTDFLICFLEVFTLSNLHVLFFLKQWEVRLQTGSVSVFYLKIQKLMRHLTAVRIRENVQFPICHSETFGVKNQQYSIGSIFYFCKALNYKQK
jgi:hypothetical protein